jgi:hypothetical protein
LENKGLYILDTNNYDFELIITDENLLVDGIAKIFVDGEESLRVVNNEY